MKDNTCQIEAIIDSLGIDMTTSSLEEAVQANKISLIKKSHSGSIKTLKTRIKNNKAKLTRWLAKKANRTALLGGDNGTYRGNIAEVSRRTNPPKIEPFNSKATPEQLVQQLSAAGFDNAIRTRHEPNLEVLATLSDDELASAGFQRKQSFTITVKPLDKGTKAKT